MFELSLIACGLLCTSLLHGLLPAAPRDRGTWLTITVVAALAMLPLLVVAFLLFARGEELERACRGQGTADPWPAFHRRVGRGAIRLLVYVAAATAATWFFVG